MAPVSDRCFSCRVVTDAAKVVITQAPGTGTKDRFMKLKSWHGSSKRAVITEN